MSNSLLERLIAAQTDEERSWIVTENLLESLPKDVASALWAVAIPHWFDAEILAALCPELADRADEIYRQLQDLSCVEVFPERGHNVHELTRNQLLDRLWQDKPEFFRSFSGKAAEYFARGDSPKNQIECIYHLAVADPTVGINYLSNLAQRWDSNYLRAELESLIVNLQQQISADRTTIATKAETNYWDGRSKFRFYQAIEALEKYEVSLNLYKQLGDHLGVANTLKSIGDILQFLDRRSEALASYEESLTLYREIGARLGEAQVSAILNIISTSNGQETLNHQQKKKFILYRYLDRLVLFLAILAPVLLTLASQLSFFKHYNIIASDPQTTVTPTPSISSTATPNPPTFPITSALGKSDLSQDQAVAILENWLNSKSRVFAPPYDKQLAKKFTTGSLYYHIAEKTNGSIDWLRNNNSYFKYSLSRIDNVLEFNNLWSNPTLKVRITEDRTLYSANGSIDHPRSGKKTANYTYYFAKEDDGWKISDYRDE